MSPDDNNPDGAAFADASENQDRKAPITEEALTEELHQIIQGAVHRASGNWRGSFKGEVGLILALLPVFYVKAKPTEGDNE